MASVEKIVGIHLDPCDEGHWHIKVGIGPHADSDEVQTVERTDDSLPAALRSLNDLLNETDSWVRLVLRS